MKNMSTCFSVFTLMYSLIFSAPSSGVNSSLQGHSMLGGIQGVFCSFAFGIHIFSSISLDGVSIFSRDVSIRL